MSSSSLPGALPLRWWWRGRWSQHMMDGGLGRGAGCLFDLDPGQKAPSWCMQGTSTSHTYLLTIRLRRVHRVVYVAPLGELCSRSDGQALQLYWFGITCHIPLLPDDQEVRWSLSSSFSPLRSPQRGPLIDPVHLICATQPGVSHTSPIYVWLQGWRS